MTTIVFMGSPDFSLPTLRAFPEHMIWWVLSPSLTALRAAGVSLKAPPVKRLALELGTPVIQPEKLRQPEAMEQLRAWTRT